MDGFKVRQWSFCKECRGVGCSACGGKGATVELIPLKLLGGWTRKEYVKNQADFIREQEGRRRAGEGAKSKKV